MAFIRKREEEKTGFQSSYKNGYEWDFAADFAMVYGIGDSMMETIDSFKKTGHVIHLMTGISWGSYRDYLEGRWDGEEHMDEAQEDRFGNKIMHGLKGEDIKPYMVPTISFADYLAEKLKKAVDAGVEAIHVEEPEFWDRGGYSPAFRREFEIYYKTPWVAPCSSVDAHYKCARLKAYLYKRTIERVSAVIKDYAKKKYNKNIRFYVPTHSLLNYTQWKIVSPEASLTEVPGVDGYIAQIWTGTARTNNVYEGVIGERTFETAYLEYGIMQELVKGTGRRMWFLHDPIEDQPCYDWAGYQENYLKTVTASLLHSGINDYEICPWPTRVFQPGSKYPRFSPNGREIGDEYRSILAGCFQMLGDIPVCKSSAKVNVGILMSDTSLYQRNFPDGILKQAQKNEVGTVLKTNEDEKKEFEEVLFAGKGDDDLRHRFEITDMLPAFYGLALPLLIHGVPIRPVLLDNARRYVGYLDDYDVLVMSYEYCKPDYPDENAAVANWVRAGGTLLYVGDGFDPFHKIEGFWTGRYPTAAEHLFALLGIEPKDSGEGQLFKVDKGTVGVWKTSPAAFSYSRKNAEAWRNFYGKVVGSAGHEWKRTNYLTEQRGPYTVAAVFAENENKEPLSLKGLYVDMYSADLAVVKDPVVRSGEDHVYLDLSKIEDEKIRVVGTQGRVISADVKDDSIELVLHAAGRVKAHTRLRTPWPVSCETEGVGAQYDPLSRTVLLTFEGEAKEFPVTLRKAGD